MAETSKTFVPEVKDIRNIILIFPIFFFVMYIETIPLPFSPDLVWKLPLILGLLFYVIRQSPGTLKYPKFFVYGIALAFKQLLVFVPKTEYLVTAAKVASLDLMVPTFTLFFIKNISKRRLEKYLFYFCSLLILANIPYHLGLLTNYVALISKGEQAYDLSKFGGSGSIFTGPFVNFHDTAITLSFTLVCVLYFYERSTSKLVKAFILAISLLSLYSVYITYARTALVMLLFGFFVYGFVGKSAKFVFRSVVASLALGIVVYFIYISSTVFQLRLQDTNVYGSEAGAGSGRADYWAIMLGYSVDNGVGSFLMGTGREAGMDYMEKKLGERLFSHNGFIDIFVSAGFIGIMIFFAYQKYLFQRLRVWANRRIIPSYRLGLIIWVMYWMAILFQGHQYFWVFIIISLVVAIMEKEYLEGLKDAAVRRLEYV
jgi:O-antigen ligase